VGCRGKSPPAEKVRDILPVRKRPKIHKKGNGVDVPFLNTNEGVNSSPNCRQERIPGGGTSLRCEKRIFSEKKDQKRKEKAMNIFYKKTK